MRLLIWGVGKDANNLYFPKEVEFLGSIDSDVNKQGKMFRGKEIIAPEKIKDYDYDYILISSTGYGDQIFKQIKQMGIETNKVIPAELFSVQISSRFERMHRKIVTTEHFRIVKDWYQNEDRREIIVKVKEKLGHILKIRVFPYGYFMAGADVKNKGRIVDVLTDRIIYEGEWSDLLELDIPIETDAAILKISVAGNDSCFLGVDYKEGDLLKKIKRMSSVEQQQRFLADLAHCNQNMYQEKDYSVLQQFSALKDYTILDIGANMGQSSLSFLKSTQMDVIALEPQPIMMEPLQIVEDEFKKRNRVLRIVNKGAGEKEGALQFYIPKYAKDFSQECSFEKGRVVERIEMAFPGKSVTDDDVIEIEVPVITVDELTKEIDKPVFFIKIDVENFEVKVIRGMKETIKKYHPLIMLEFNSFKQQEEICDFVNEIYHYSIKYWNYKELCFEDTNKKGSINYFLVPKDFEFPMNENS